MNKTTWRQRFDFLAINLNGGSIKTPHPSLIYYNAYRYFQPEGYDVFLKRRAKGRGNKVPLTIGMLYRAMKAQRWDIQELEPLTSPAKNYKDMVWTY